MHALEYRARLPPVVGSDLRQGFRALARRHERVRAEPGRVARLHGRGALAHGAHATLNGIRAGRWTAAARAAEMGAMEATSDPALEARYRKLTDELRCLVCQNQTIADSNVDLAKDLRRQVRQMMADGATDDEILDYMVARYGDFVRYRPPLTPRTWLLWSAPVLMLVIGLLVGLSIIRRRASMDPDLDDTGDRPA